MKTKNKIPSKLDQKINCKNFKLCGNIAHHHHYIDWEKNPIPKGKHDLWAKKHPKKFQNLCTLCHAKVHGIEPKISETRRLVILLNRTQKARVTINNQFREFTNIEMNVPNFMKELSEKLNEEEKSYVKQIKDLLEGRETIKMVKPMRYLSPYPIYNWLKEIKGISHILAGKIIAYIDIKNSPTIASLWAYSGQTPDSKKQKGKKCNWNHELKIVCYQISDSFIKQRTPKYREIYDKEKEKQLILLEKSKKETTIALKTKTTVSPKKRGNQDQHKNHFEFASPPKSLNHAHKRAMRKSVKEFLKDLWIKWRKLENLSVSKSFEKQNIEKNGNQRNKK